MEFITDTERKQCLKLESVMGVIHRVTDAYRLIDNTKQPEDFKARLRADLPARIADMEAACRELVAEAAS